MLRITTGDLLADDAEALVNTVNCDGVMGRGIALQFKNRWPDNFKAYAHACKAGQVRPGSMFVFPTGKLLGPKWVINFPTKRHWREKSRLEDICSGLEALVRVVREHKIQSIAIPPLGAGLGGLPWQSVRPLIVSAFEALPEVEVRLYEPRQATPTKADIGTKPIKVPAMTPGRAALVGLLHRYQTRLMDVGISLLEVHKLMYFLQAAGEPLQLKFAKAPRGPFAENLSHVLKQVEGHLISGYGDGGDSPDKPITVLPTALAPAEALLATAPATLERLKKVERLIDGFESAYSLELLATIHWLLTHPPTQATPDLPTITAALRAWGPSKHHYSAYEIQVATRACSAW